MAKKNQQSWIMKKAHTQSGRSKIMCRGNYGVIGDSLFLHLKSSLNSDLSYVLLLAFTTILGGAWNRMQDLCEEIRWKHAELLTFSNQFKNTAMHGVVFKNFKYLKTIRSMNTQLLIFEIKSQVPKVIAALYRKSRGRVRFMLVYLIKKVPSKMKELGDLNSTRNGCGTIEILYNYASFLSWNHHLNLSQKTYNNG